MRGTKHEQLRISLKEFYLTWSFVNGYKHRTTLDYPLGKFPVPGAWIDAAGIVIDTTSVSSRRGCACSPRRRNKQAGI